MLKLAKSIGFARDPSMNTFETYIAVAVTLLFVTGAGLIVVARRESTRVRKQWDRRA